MNEGEEGDERTTGGGDEETTIVDMGEEADTGEDNRLTVMEGRGDLDEDLMEMVVKGRLRMMVVMVDGLELQAGVVLGEESRRPFDRFWVV